MRVAVAASALALTLVSPPASASEATTASVGLTLAGAFAPRPAAGGLHSGFALGTEASVVHYFGFSGGWVKTPDWFVGGYATGLRDFDAELSRISTGARVGYGFFALDAGPVMQVEHGRADAGILGRAMVDVFFTAPYLAVGALPGSERPWFAELGVTVRLPFDVDKRRIFR